MKRDIEKGFWCADLGEERVGEERDRFNEGRNGGSGVRKGLDAKQLKGLEVDRGMV